VDTAAPKPEVLVLSDNTLPPPSIPLPSHLLHHLFSQAEADACGLTVVEFALILSTIGTRLNHNLPPGADPSAQQREAFFHALHLPELALAHACALGKDAAWERFLRLHRAALTQTAIAITASASLGEELADSLYAELYGIRSTGAERRSPFASYSGRGSLQGWLRTTLVQRFHDHHRRTHRESPLDNIDTPAPELAPPTPSEPSILEAAVARTLGALPSEDRFLLAAYFLDRWTLLQIARTLAVHEATISRRLKRLVSTVRASLLQNLQRSGLSKRAAEESLGADPRDLEINLRAILQTSQRPPFSQKEPPASDSA
jgi:RNA polymerase sigma-70 factor (ECF subfamily)